MSLKIEQTIILIMIFFGYLGKYNCCYFQFINISNDKVSEYLTMVFGITSVIATLVGLVTIFASLAVQHKIDKSKELLWTLKDLHSDNQEYKPLDVHRQLVKLLRAYDYASSYEEQKSTNIISLAKSTLIIIYLIWIVIGFALITRYTLFEFYSILLILIIVGVLLLRYYNYLEQLKDFRIMSGLPSLQQMLDADCDKGLKGLAFASALMDANLIKIKDGDNRALLIVRLSPPFYNFSVLVEATYFKTDISNGVNAIPIGIAKRDVYLRKIHDKHNLGLDYSTSHKVAVLKFPSDDYDILELKLILLSNQGMAKNEYLDITKEELMALGSKSMNFCYSLKRPDGPLDTYSLPGFVEREVLLAKKDKKYTSYLSGSIKDLYK